MKWNKIRIFSVMLATGLVCAPVQASSITSSDLPTDSNWYVHINLDLIRNSDVGREFALETMDEALDDIQDELNIDIRDEIEGVTVFGAVLPVRGSHMSDGAVILHGPISDETQAALFSALEQKGAVVSTLFDNSLAWYTVSNANDEMTYTEEDGSVRDLSWDDQKVLYFSFGETQALVTQSMEMMQIFLDAGGYLGSFESVDTDALLVLQADRALMQGGANTSAEIAGEWDSSVLKNLDAVALVVAEDNGGLQISAQLQANSAEVAMSVRNIVEGMVALKALSEPDGALGDILRNVRFLNDGSVLHVDVPVAADQIEALKDL